METTAAPLLQPPNIKQLADSPDLHFIPSNYVHSTNDPGDSSATDPDDSNSIPIIDFSLLTSGDPHQRSIAIHNLSKACQDWGFFMVSITNHVGWLPQLLPCWSGFDSHSLPCFVLENI